MEATTASGAVPPPADRPRRGYHSPVRERRAADNRRRIVEAAADAFSELGYAGTAMTEIATRAGVSVELVYATGNKAFLLLEAFRLRYTGEGGWNSVMEQDWAQDLLSITDAEQGLTAVVDFLATAHARSADLWLVVRTTATVVPVVAEAFAELNRYRWQSWGESVDWMIAIGLVESADPAQRHRLAAVASTVASAETYVQFRHDWEFTDADYRTWLAQALRDLRP